MATRQLHTTDRKSDCGCSGQTTSDGACEALTYSDCPQTFKPIKQKSTRRLCLDFSKESCGDCCDGFYERIRVVKIERSNPPNCPDSEGFIRISQENMDAYSGLYCFTLDANDSRLNYGERFKITIWARLPNTEETCIEAYISVGN
jgi:hypothetical protein